jgi:SagB-type dehydrogenase family enzyme
MRKSVSVAPAQGLPRPQTKGGRSLEECLAERRSVRSYRIASMTAAELGQLLWAAQGITAEGQLRTAPSAGALYPLELYVVAARVEGFVPAVYHYRADHHELTLVRSGDASRELARASLEQECVRDSAAMLLFAAVYSRTTGKYGQRGIGYVHMEAGHAAQNVLLQATALGLGAVPVAAFRDDEVKQIAQLPQDHAPIYMVAVGKR